MKTPSVRYITLLLMSIAVVAHSQVTMAQAPGAVAAPPVTKQPAKQPAAVVTPQVAAAVTPKVVAAATPVQPTTASATGIANKAGEPAEPVLPELQHTIAYAQSVKAAQLMTQHERAEYRRAVKSAPNPEAQQQIRELTYSRLRQRATERGMVLREPTRQQMPGGQRSENTYTVYIAPKETLHGEGGKSIKINDLKPVLRIIAVTHTSPSHTHAMQFHPTQIRLPPQH